MKKTELSLLAGLLLALFFTGMADINHTAEKIRKDTLRLHIIAASDSRQDQAVKLAVKEAVSSLCSEICSPAENLQQAVALAQENMQYIEQTVNHTLQSQGVEYTAECSIEQFFFPTTEYENFTMPAGNYTALTIRLGGAAGRNWWCVAWPALCTSPRAQYEDDSSNTFIETDTFRFKFKIVEIRQDIKHFFEKDTPLYTSVY